MGGVINAVANRGSGRSEGGDGRDPSARSIRINQRPFDHGPRLTTQTMERKPSEATDPMSHRSRLPKIQVPFPPRSVAGISSRISRIGAGALCVKARGREDDHKKIKEDEQSDKPVVGIDTKSFGQSDETDNKATQSVVRAAQISARFAQVCEQKGSADHWVVVKLMEDIGSFVHVEVILKADGEPALVQVLNTR